MKSFVAGDCVTNSVFELVDPTSYYEADFEREVIKAVNCVEPHYICGVFSGTFQHQGVRRTADLALLHKSLSHWFVVEVELAGHSLEHHVLPQVRCFRYGDPEDGCISSLVRAFPALGSERAEWLLRYVPRHVAVIGNLRDSTWHTALNALDTQYLTVSVYRDGSGRIGYEVEGQLIARTESLGFARYSDIDRCLRIKSNCGLPEGRIQLIDQFGVPGLWVVREEKGTLWVTKERGPTLLQHDSLVQLLRTHDGRISLRPSGVGLSVE